MGLALVALKDSPGGKLSLAVVIRVAIKKTKSGFAKLLSAFG